jgi:hypothetical protein
MAKFKLLRRVLTKWLVQTKIDDQTMQQCSEFHWQVRRKQSSLPPEQNFRRILKKHILKLLQNQKEYWRKKVYSEMDKIWG